MSKNITIENATREQIAEFLPEAIELAVASYKQYMTAKEVIDKDGNVSEPKFVDLHKNAKIAISHIELLIKLAKWADLPDKAIIGDKEADYLNGLMVIAEAEIGAYSDDTLSE